MKEAHSKKSRLFIVSNRLPVSIQKTAGRYQFERSVGGLATGLTNLLKKIRGYWIGWPGIVDVSTKRRSEITQKLKGHYNCIPVFLDAEEMDKYYNGFSNSTIWPLFHYQSMFTTYNELHWKAYKDVNRKIARKVLEHAGKDDIIWVHDYHLLLLPGMLRKALPEAKIGFFLHIPFPSQELFRLLPWRQEILEGLLGSDLIGFHTYDYTRHFLSCCLRLDDHDNEFGRLCIENRFVWVETFPMGIDVDKFFDLRTRSVRTLSFAKDLPNKKIILSVDRMDITKGIPERLNAFERFLEKYPQWTGKVIYVLISSPSRTHILNYQKLKKNVDELVGRINGRFSTLNWTPVQYIYQSVSQEDLTYLYRRSHVALITPLRDGMNLVAKEYIASRSDYKGVLILSEGAGACSELVEAIVVNPNDIEKTADAIHEGLTLPVDEQMKRNRKMITRLRRYDIFRWGEDFVETLIKRAQERQNLSNSPLTPEIAKDIVRQYKRAKRRVIFLDYDGTLVAHYKKLSLA
ncbi:MAG: bifunctional alpha,alpha-trehalose-phosphate synthase (UDP-forming)/trehalose-phosphatase, partial [Candidatus Aureabacteria bacterium]|nr:bifunctional alpha,alpha-trehalose-phosphate synthase (UDP-forming)/trehalose-phosphatase [Candidatus Auribacterota bacterium]